MWFFYNFIKNSFLFELKFVLYFLLWDTLVNHILLKLYKFFKKLASLLLIISKITDNKLKNSK